MNAPTYINSTHRALARNPGGLTLDEIAGKIRAKAKKAAEQVRELHDLGMIQTTEEAGQPVYKLDEAAAVTEIPAPEYDPKSVAFPAASETRIRVMEGKQAVAEVGDTDVVELGDSEGGEADAPANFATTPELQYLAPEDYEMPPADPALLASANRALGVQLEAITAERDDLRARLDVVTQQIEHLKAELSDARAIEATIPLSARVGQYDAQRIASLSAELQALRTSSANAINEADRMRAEVNSWVIKNNQLRQENDALLRTIRAEGSFGSGDAVGYLVCATKRKPRRINDGERAKFAALAAVRAGAARAEVLAVVPVGTARRGAEWRAK